MSKITSKLPIIDSYIEVKSHVNIKEDIAYTNLTGFAQHKSLQAQLLQKFLCEEGSKGYINMWGFTSQNNDIITRDAVVEGPGNLDHLVFFTVHRHRTVHGPRPYRLHWTATTAASIEPATFGSAAEHPSHWSTEVD